MDKAVFDAAKGLYAFMSSCPSLPEKADMILVLGSHDLRVPDHAAELFLAGLAPLIVCSGGYGKMTEGVFAQPEGAVFAKRCTDKGVPAEAVLVEDRASNTGENFAYSRSLTRGRDIRTAVAVCKPYMAKRAMAAGQKQWPGVSWSVSVPNIPFEAYSPDENALFREIELMTGDLQRLKIYAEKGFQTPVDIPEEVWDSYRLLAEAGFDKYVIG